MTALRKLILDIVNESSDFLSAEQICAIAKKQMPSAVMATVYNSLNYLTSNELINRIITSGQPDLYEKSSGTHAHTTCEMCKKVSDLDFPEFKNHIEKKYGISVVSCNIELRYICPECLEK